MERIIAGRFETRAQADATAALLVPYIDSSDICIFQNNPPGQHDPAASDTPEHDVDAEGASRSATGTAFAAGLAAGAVGTLGGPAVALVAAGVGAYAGSFAGALGGMSEETATAEGDAAHAPDQRPGGVMLSVRISEPVDEVRVIAMLRAEGAADIEQAEGEWSDGDWTDFDPLAKPRLVRAVVF